MILPKLRAVLSAILNLFKPDRKGGTMPKNDRDDHKTTDKEARKEKWQPDLKTKFSSRFDWKKLLK